MGRPNPFELHIVTPAQYREWYAKFIKKYVKIMASSYALATRDGRLETRGLHEEVFRRVA